MKFSRNQIIIAALIIVLIAGIGIYFFTRNNSSTASNNPNTNQNTVSIPSTPLAKVEPPSTVDFTSYKVATLKDGRQMLLVPKELTTREPFASAITRNKIGSSSLNSKVYFTFNPTTSGVEFVNGYLNNFALLNIKNSEYWFFSLTNQDGTESLFYSLPDFSKQTKITEFPSFAIVNIQSLPTLVKVTANTAQRGEKLEVYNIDFTSAGVISNSETKFEPLIQPIVTLQK
jgi:hypothetical protein